MTDLSDYGGGIQPPEPPTVQKQQAIRVPVGDRRIVAGWVGPCPERDGRAFVSKRDEHEHRIRALDAYGISESVFQRLRGRGGVQVVLVHEAREDRVLEFLWEQWADARDVPEEYLMRSDDPQRYVTRSRAHTHWDDHGDSLYLPQDVDVV